MYPIEFMLIYTKPAWDTCMSYVSSSINISDITDCISKADEHHVSAADEHCLILHGLDIDITKNGNFCRALWDNVSNYLSPSMYYHRIVFPDGGENNKGTWIHNPFGGKVKKTFIVSGNYSSASAASAHGPIGKHTTTVVSPGNKAPMPPAVNNHTCVACGNKKCSKNEKQCWICTYPINP